jgi:hypothetical protein
MASTQILAALEEDKSKRYYEHMSKSGEFGVQIVNSLKDALGVIEDRDQHVDVLVLDNELHRAFDFVDAIRKKYPRLIIVLVDEGADFGLPGQADELSTEPFRHDELMRKITKLMSDRRMETLRSDSLPAVRNISKQLRQATGNSGKQNAAVEVIKDMGYDYVAYYHITGNDPMELRLQAQAGPNAVNAIAPKKANDDDLMGWVAKNGQSRIASPDDRPTHPLVARGRLGAVVCVPVAFNKVSYGVLAACNDRPGSIPQDSVLMLELVSTQLAAALSKA